ncbi:S-layer homology domain-containing protein, partial [Patescibacteria group bacterium]|nr:S-layer homology domain-containing protein [Patescibacteria group bacterium]
MNLLKQYDNDEAKKTVPKPGSAYKPMQQIFLIDTPKLKLTLANLLARWGQVDGVDNNNNKVIDETAEASSAYGVPATDNMMIGEKVMMNKKSYVFTGAQNDAYKTVNLNVVPVAAVDKNNKPIFLSSFTPHSEPSSSTLSANYDVNNSGNLIARIDAPQSISIDQPRYFNFKDKKGEYRKIMYPNLFAVNSVEEARAILAAKEAELKEIADDTSVKMDIMGELTGFLDKDNGDNPNYKQMDDSYRWKAMNIDEKHVYVFKTYLDPDKTAYIGDTAKGYESLYFVAGGDAGKLEMNFNGNIPEVEEDSAFKAAQNQKKPEMTKAAPAAAGAAGSDPDLASMFAGIFIFLWFGEIIMWVDETIAKVDAITSGLVCGISDGDGNYYDQLLASGDLDGDGVPDSEDPNPHSGDSDGDGIPDGAENTRQIRLSASKPVLEAGSTDSIVITAEGLSAQSVLQTSDSNTEIELILGGADSPRATVASANPVKLQGGRATFTLLPTDETGFFTVTARAVARPEITSNSLSIESTKRKIRLVSYKKDIGPIYDQGGASGFIILDEKDQIIAEVDGITGLVSIKDTRFDLVSLASSGNKPVRLGVREKSSGTVRASVFFVANKQKAIAIDGKEMDFFKQWQDLSGVHVLDFAGDDYGIEHVPANAEFGAGNVYLTAKGKRAGIVDRLGNVYLKPELSLRLKQTINSTDPVVFEILNESGATVYEIFIAAKYPKIRIFREEGNFTGFNLALMAVAGMRDLAGGFMEFPAMLNGFLSKAHAAFAPDTDGDGLNDLEEIFIKTDLNNADTDGDGYKDESEFLQNYNPTVAGASLFADLTPATSGFDDIIKLIRRGVLSLPTDGLFHPNDLLTREEFVRLNLGAICIQCVNFDSKVKQAVDEIYGKSPFPDTDISGELKYCVEEGKNQGIVSGYKGTPKTGYFLPRDFISRAEATKVILETGKQVFPKDLVIKDTVEAGKPWYYNYIISAQKAKLFPKGKFMALDTLSPQDFKVWFDKEIAKGSGSTFIGWIGGDITRKEFAMMVSSFTNLYDCTQIDTDGEGLPDNYEKYIYTTSPTNPDTDGGGVNDFLEVLNGTNPLYAPDDIKEKELEYDDDKDGMPSLWEKDYGLNPYDPKDAPQDPDGDGLTNLEEYKYGTNPFDPDTDDGGVNDGDEVIKGTDPLNPADDYFPLVGDEGGYIVGNTVFDNYIYEQLAPSEATDFQNFDDEIPADGLSKLLLKASILNENGDINDTDFSSIINFFATDETGAYATLSPQSVIASAGVAETEVTSTVKAGTLMASAEVGGKYYPVDERPIYVVPLEPFRIEMRPRSPVIRSGGLSTSVVHMELMDKNDNLINTNLSFFTVDVSGAGTIDESLDENGEAPGVQVSTVDGTYDLTVTSTADPGIITVKASYFDASAAPTEAGAQPAVSAQTQIQSRDDIRLVIKSTNNFVPSDYVSTTNLKLEVQDNSGAVVTSFQGASNFSLMNKELGELIGSGDVDVINGSATTIFHAFNKAGDAVVSATAQGFPPAQGTVTVYPKQAVQVILEADDDVFGMDSGTLIKGKLYDTDGNFANNDSQSVVTFQLTDSSKSFAQFDGPVSVQAVNGVVSIDLRGKGITGPVNILATSPGMVSGTLSLRATTILKSTDLNDVTPQVLFASLLGSDFGNIFEQNYFAGWFIFAGKDKIIVDPNTFAPKLERDLGKAEVTVSLLSSPKPVGRLVTIMPNGNIKLLDDQRMGVTVIPRNESNRPNRILLSDLDA